MFRRTKEESVGETVKEDKEGREGGGRVEEEEVCV